MASFNMHQFFNPTAALGPQTDYLQGRPNPFTSPEAWDFSPVGGVPSSVGGGTRGVGPFQIPVVGSGAFTPTSFGSTQPVLPTFGGVDGPTGGSDGGLGSTVGNVAGSVWDWIKGHPDLLLGAAGLYQTYQGQRAANRLTDQSIQAAEQSYSDRAPLRAVGLAGLADLMGGTGARPASGVGIDATNPYVAASAAPAPATPTTPATPTAPVPEVPRRRVPTTGGAGGGSVPLPTPTRSGGPRLRAVGRNAI